MVVPVFAFAQTTNDALIAQLQAQIAALQAQINAILQQQGTISPNINFQNGDRVEAATNSLAVRQTPTTSGLVVGRVNTGAGGVIRCDQTALSCPTIANGYRWWYIDWDSAALPSGWSAEGTSEADFLTKVGTSSSLPESAPNPNPMPVPSPLSTAQPASTSSITVLSPKEGDQWGVGNTYRISWQPFPAHADTYVYLNGGGHEEGYTKYIGSPIGNAYIDYVVIASDLPTAPGYSWKVIVCDGQLISGGANCGFSGNVFVVTTVMPAIAVLAPNGGETLVAGNTYTIRWNASNFPSNATIYIELRSRSSVGNYIPAVKIAVVSPASGNYIWQIPGNTVPDQYVIEVYKSDQNGIIDPNESVKDISDAPFSIVAPTSTANVQVSLDSSTPLSQLIFQGQSADFTAVRIVSSVNVTLDCWRIKLNGYDPLSTRQAFVGVTVNTEVNVVPLGSDAGATLCGQPVTLQANVPTVIHLRAMMAGNLSQYAGRVVSLSLVGFSTSVPFSTATGFPVGGNNMTLNSTYVLPTLSVSLDPSTPAARTLPAGSVDVTLTALSFHTSGEAISLQKIALQFDGSNRLALLGTQSLWDGTTLVGTIVFASNFTTVTLNQPVFIPKDGTKTLVIKGALSQVGTAQPAQVGDTIAVNYDGDNIFGTSGVGQLSSLTVNSSTRTDTAAPKITVGGTPSTLTIFRSIMPPASAPFHAGDDAGVFTMDIPSSLFLDTNTVMFHNLTEGVDQQSSYSVPVLKANNVCDTSGHCRVTGTWSPSQFICRDPSTPIKQMTEWMTIGSSRSNTLQWYFQCSNPVSNGGVGLRPTEQLAAALLGAFQSFQDGLTEFWAPLFGF